LAVAFVGFMPALDVARPPGELSPGVSMFSYGVDNCAVTMDTVSVARHDIIIALPADFSVSNSGIRKLTVGTRYDTIKPILNTGQTENYYLRL
jgi:hypothetical protein